jgi:hypothetical protein
MLVGSTASGRRRRTVSAARRQAIFLSSARTFGPARRCAPGAPGARSMPPGRAPPDPEAAGSPRAASPSRPSDGPCSPARCRPRGPAWSVGEAPSQRPMRMC